MEGITQELIDQLESQGFMWFGCDQRTKQFHCFRSQQGIADVLGEIVFKQQPGQAAFEQKRLNDVLPYDLKHLRLEIDKFEGEYSIIRHE